MKVRNIKLDPRVSIFAISDGFFGKWAQVDGMATIVEMPEAMALLRFNYSQIPASTLTGRSSNGTCSPRTVWQ